MKRNLAGALTIALLAAGCGGHGGDRAAAPARTSTTRHTHVPTHAARDYRRLYGDVHAMRNEAAKARKGTLLGTKGLQRTTGAFLDDLDASVLGPKARNRLIDHAAAAVATSCEQCFQMLEAVRPIPQIAGH